MTDQADLATEGEKTAAAGAAGKTESAEGGVFGRKGGRKKLIFFAAIALLGLGGGYLSGFLGGWNEHGEKRAEHAQGALVSPVAAHYLDLDEMMITIGGVGTNPHVLKMRLSLELKSPQDELRVKAIMPRILDNFHMFLRELRIEELQGSQGLYRVKEELMTRVNSAAYPTKVQDILFREMLVQ